MRLSRLPGKNRNMKRWFSVLFLLWGILALAFLLAPPHTEAASTYYVPNDYGSIQAAVTAASDGDTIIVRDGTYHENVDVNKRLTIRSENGYANCVVSASDPNDHVFAITVDYVNISGFTIKNATNAWSAGIDLQTVDFCNISNNNVYHNDVGIYLKYSENNTIIGNNVSDHDYGIYLIYSSNNNVTNNHVCDTPQNGIYIRYSHNTIITGNNASDNDKGIYLQDANNTIITGNNASDNNYGIYLYVYNNNATITGNNASNNQHGIYLEYADNNATITGNNVISNSQHGIYLDGSHNATITGNNASDNDYGIYLEDSNNNNITGHNSSNNDFGIYLDGSSNNNITGNIFSDDGLYVHFSYYNTVTGNTVNGKPLIYLEGFSDTTVSSAGQVILVNSSNITVHNLDLSNTTVGVQLGGTDNCSIMGNIVSNNTHGIDLWSSRDNHITGHNTPNNIYGIYLWTSSDNNITGNNASNAGVGFGLFGSDSNSITGNNASNNYLGFWLYTSSNNNITGNNITSNLEFGIYLVFVSNSNLISGNNVSSNNNCSIFLYVSSNNTISFNNISNNECGIYLDNSSNNNISGNTIRDNTNDGIYLDYSSNNNMSGNTIHDNSDDGIDLEYSDDNNISGNTIRDNTYDGIDLDYSDDNNISGNTIHDNSDDGMQIDYSDDTNISGNTIINNTEEGIDLNYCNNSNILGNTISNNTEEGINLDHSDDTNISGNTIRDNTNDSISLYYSDDNNISGNTIRDNTNDGISLYYSDDNNISGNTIRDNYDGIDLEYSDDNNISGNTIRDNSDDGMQIDDSDDNNISGNTVINNTEEGIDLNYCNNNKISYCTLSNNNPDINVTLSSSTLFYRNTFSSYPTMASFSHSGDFEVSGVNSPPAMPSDFVNISKFLDITNHSAGAWMNITFYYEEGNLAESTYEDEMEIWKHNGSWYQTGWHTYKGIDTTVNEIWANITDFGSIFAPLQEDKTPPVITEITDSPDPQESGGSVNIACRVTDRSLVDFVKVNITYPDSSWVNETMLSGSYHFETTYTQVGTYYYYIWAQDTAGNAASSSTYSFVVVSSEPPWSWLTVTLDPDGYFKRASTFHIYGDDNIGPWRIHYRIDNGNEQIGGWNAVVNFQLNELGGYGSGPHGIEYWAEDFVGNSESPHHHETYVLDTTAPHTTIAFDGPHEWAHTQWHISPETGITLTASDHSCGVKATYYRVNDGNWTQYTGTFMLETPGIHHLIFYSEDRLGNKENPVLEIIEVGGVLPMTMCLLNPVHPDGDNGWYTTEVMVTLTAADDISGVASTFYSIDENEWQEYTGSFAIETDGRHTLKYYSVDNAANQEHVQSTPVAIDTTAPDLAFQQPTSGYLYIMGREILPLPRTIIIGKAILSVDANDETSGIERIDVYIDDILATTLTDTPYQWTWDELALFSHTIKAVAYDDAGHMAMDEQVIWIFNF